MVERYRYSLLSLMVTIAVFALIALATHIDDAESVFHTAVIVDIDSS
jgi:hypothetical protein